MVFVTIPWGHHLERENSYAEIQRLWKTDAAVINNYLVFLPRFPVPLHDTLQSILTAGTGLLSPLLCYMGIYLLFR